MIPVIHKINLLAIVKRHYLIVKSLKLASGQASSFNCHCEMVLVIYRRNHLVSFFNLKFFLVGVRNSLDVGIGYRRKFNFRADFFLKTDA